MPQDLLKTGLAWLSTQLNANAASEVDYLRGAESVTLRATFGEKLLKLQDEDGGLRMEWTDVDFLIPAADLVLGGARVEPRRGDLVRVEGDDGTARLYEVRPMGGDPAWRYADPHRSMVRIHAKFAELIEPYS